MLYISILVYNIFIKLYETAIYLIASQNDKAARWYHGRQGIFNKIASALAGEENAKAERIWMHCASLGEFEQGRPLLEALRKEKPDALIVLTFFSPSGYEVRKNYPNADHVFYLPADTKNNARRFLYLIRPTLVVFVKYEFWFHYFREVSRLGVRFILISAIFRKKQIFFKWYGTLHRKMLSYLTHIFVQDEQSAALLMRRGVNNVSQTNDTRIDRVVNIAANARSLPTVEMFLEGQKALVCGSIYEKENELLHRAFRENILPGKLILAPHQVDPPHITAISKVWGDEAVIYTTFNEQEAKGKRVLIVDTVGLLSNIYRYGSGALIGGGFGKGIHNTLEPAAFGLPVLFGPKYKHFKEARDLLDLGAAFCFSDYEQLKSILVNMPEPAFAAAAGGKSYNYIHTHTGGTDKIMAWLRG